MKRFYLFIGFFLLSGLFASPVKSNEHAEDFFDGVSQYRNQHYEKALEKFDKIRKQGIENGKLYYNLGNCHLKNGRLGHALLWYERALKRIPRDPDLKFNLDYARFLVKDEKDQPSSRVFTVLFFWKDLLSQRAVQWTALVFNLLFWVTAAIRLFDKKNLSGVLRFVCLIFACLFAFTAFYNHYEKSRLKEGIVLSKTVSVRSGFTKGSTELFVLHSGTKVRIEKKKGRFYRIYFSKGKIGWVGEKEIGVI